MKRKGLLVSLAIISIFSLSILSCKKESTPAPTVQISFSVDGYQVAFTALVTNADTYAWDFGDGKTSTEQNPVHVYEQSGKYDVSLTVNGKGGSATANTQVEIAASKLEMLTGGPAATDGKSWQFSNQAGEGDAVLHADKDFTVDPSTPIVSGILGMIGYNSEYNDEFIFKNNNGNYEYSHITDNDSVLTNAIFAMANNISGRPNDMTDLILLTPFTPEAATFKFMEDTTLELNVTSDESPDSTWTESWSGVDVIEIEGGKEFIGVQDFTRKYIAFKLTADELQLGMFISATTGNYAATPSHVLRMTFTPKQ